MFHYNGIDYKIEIIKKHNKNTYIRFKDNKIVITTNYFVSNTYIKQLVSKNKDKIEKMIAKYTSKHQSDNNFYIFGQQYDIIYNQSFSVKDNIIYAKDAKELEEWLQNYITEIFHKHLMFWYHKFTEPIPIPNLKIRNMKSRWGVCNRKNNNITLNLELFKYDIECLDYVIVHELSHFVEANHSKAFWQVVFKYFPDYKRVRKKLRS